MREGSMNAEVQKRMTAAGGGIMSKKHTILVVDDAEINREILKVIFESEYNVLEASDGVEAIGIVEEHAADISVIILDLMMPRMNGFQVLETLSANEEWAVIPVIVITADGDATNEIHALDVGASDFVTKPFDQTIVRARARNFTRMRETNALRADLVRLQQQAVQDERYRTVCEQGNLVLVECNLATGERFISDNVSDQISGDFKGSGIEEMILSSGAVKSDDEKSFRTFLSRLETLPERRAAQINVRFLTPAGDYEWFLVRGSRNEMSDGSSRLIVTLQNVNDEVTSREELRYAAEHDELTGAFNRKKFYTSTREMLANNPDKQYVLVRWDIERFKIINDLYGTDAGDTLLKFIAKTLEQTLEGSGTYARVEGDDFVMCFENNDEMRERVLNHLEGELNNYPLDSKIMVCFGLYVIDDPELPVDAMCDRANLALASIKQSYLKHYAYYDETLRESLMHEQDIVNEMGAALEGGQFGIYFQPKFSLSTGKPVGSEALVRWFHPTKGIVPPGEFIPVFERNGFIARLDSYVWELTCRQLAQWKSEGKRLLPVSVNMSRVNLYRSGIVDEFRGLIKRYDIPPELLEIEITESAYTDSPEQLLQVMTQLQEAGFKVLMDDFGSGYSSLNMLKDIPVDVLKVDLRFLLDFEGGGRGGNIMRAIIGMSHDLSLPTIAEGVETAEQAAFLRGVGCEYAQGYYYSKPLPVDAYEKLIEA